MFSAWRRKWRSDIPACMKFRVCVGAVVASLLIALAAGDAFGIVIEHETDGISLKAPVDDPGWINVGVCNGWTAVYLGRGWVLTAAHVGASNIELNGDSYAADVRSRERVFNPDGTAADLMLFLIEPEPDLPALEIPTESPPIGAPIIMIGSGLGRGDKMSGRGRAGFEWKGPSIKRWGTSLVKEHLHDRSVGFTDAFTSQFSIARTAHESHAAHGDSGGAAFVYFGGRWQFAGIILAVDGYPGQPRRSAAYGNRTFYADLARYREFILGITEAVLD
jgi:hypothetical protein